MRYMTAGESHGKALMVILEGIPSKLQLDFDRIDRELFRRQQGFGRGGRMKIESDRCEFIAGVRGGMTLGSPIGIMIENKDYASWTDIMDAKAGDLKLASLTRVRPGHADLAGCQKYGFSDARHILERASARETAARVAAGAVCKEFLFALGITVSSCTKSIGGVAADERLLTPENARKCEGSILRCPDENAEKNMKKIIEKSMQDGDTEGGETVLFIENVPVGVGSHIQFDTRLDYALSGHLMGIQAVKSVSFGLNSDFCSKSGSLVHDEIHLISEKNNRELKQKIFRKTNNAGGIEGGISNGEAIVISLGIKPIPTLMRGLKTVDIVSGEECVAAAERSDTCAVPAAGVVAENVAAFVIADALMKKLGGDSMPEVLERLKKC